MIESPAIVFGTMAVFFVSILYFYYLEINVFRMFVEYEMDDVAKPSFLIEPIHVVYSISAS